MIKLLFVSAFLFLTGCATTSDNNTNTIEDKSKAKDEVIVEAKSSGLSLEEEKYSMQALNDADSPLSIRTIYFAFDSSELSPESSDVLIEHAKFLSLNPSVKVILEGHTDERGTRDYNLALGEGRSKSVHEYLTSQGVSMSQLEVVSYGEEQPVATEHNESAWQLNRRVEIVYQAN